MCVFNQVKLSFFRNHSNIRQFLKLHTESNVLSRNVSQSCLQRCKAQGGGLTLSCVENMRCLSSLAAGRRLPGPLLTSVGSRDLVKTVTRGAATKRKEVVQRHTETQPSTLTTGEKVKRAGKDATYTGIVLLGVGVTGVMFFAIGRELFSGESPNGVYTRAFKKCKKHDEVVDAVGEPMKGYGELSRRGRRRHTSHTEYEVDGERIMRMKFYIEGPLNKGTAQLEVRKREGQKFEFRYLFVTIDTYPHNTIVVEDNR